MQTLPVLCAASLSAKLMSFLAVLASLCVGEVQGCGRARGRSGAVACEYSLQAAEGGLVSTYEFGNVGMSQLTSYLYEARASGACSGEESLSFQDRNVEGRSQSPRACRNFKVCHFICSSSCTKKGFSYARPRDECLYGVCPLALTCSGSCRSAFAVSSARRCCKPLVEVASRITTGVS